MLDKNLLNPYVEFVSDDVRDYFHPEKEKKYPSTNLFDGCLKTCWVSGSAKKNKNAALYIRLPANIELDKIILNIFSGYGKSRKLFYANARPGQMRLSLFAGFHRKGFSTEVARLYIMKKYPGNKKIVLADMFGIQSFPLNLDKKKLLEFQKNTLAQVDDFSGTEYKKFSQTRHSKILSSFFILKIEIITAYQGSKYDDVCISEIFFNDRFITPYPDKYHEISKIYIKGENTLLADFVDKKGVVIYKDPSSVFTFVDWPFKTNWAVLSHVNKDAQGKGSRVEELYSLIDLRNKQAVDTKFKQYTGNTTMFIMLDKNRKGNVFIKEENYNIELK